jgi:glycosyltransferase involved in cell wall biosynthesis
MASGLPILASDIPVCREICGEAAIYFDPFDEKSLAQAIVHLAEDTTLRKRLSDAGRRRAVSQFNWTDHVRRLVTLIEEVGADA